MATDKILALANTKRNIQSLHAEQWDALTEALGHAPNAEECDTFESAWRSARDAETQRWHDARKAQSDAA